MRECPYSFESDAERLVYEKRRSVTHLPSRFQMLRIASYIRQAEWESEVALQEAKTKAQARLKAAATRAHNADPWGMKAMRALTEIA
jgi:hypothetical protein